MPVKGILYLGLFSVCVCASIILPHIGIYGYIAEYSIGPSGAWWGAPLQSLGIRTSFTLAFAVMLGIIFNRHKLDFSFSEIHSQEDRRAGWCAEAYVWDKEKEYCFQYPVLVAREQIG